MSGWVGGLAAGREGERREDKDPLPHADITLLLVTFSDNPSPTPAGPQEAAALVTGARWGTSTLTDELRRSPVLQPHA